MKQTLSRAFPYALCTLALVATLIPFARMLHKQTASGAGLEDRYEGNLLFI